MNAQPAPVQRARAVVLKQLPEVAAALALRPEAELPRQEVSVQPEARADEAAVPQPLLSSA